jgi:mono/diheme cytochrome c family protein
MATNHDHSPPAPLPPGGNDGKGELYGILAEFDTPGALVKAAHKVHDAGYTQFDAYSPFPVHGIDEAMGIKRTILPLLVFGGGLAGLFGGFFLQWWMNAWNWPLNIAGKPAWSIPANVPIGFETTILLSVLTTFFGMWALNQLPQVWHPFFRSDRFLKVTDDSFFIGIESKDPRFDAARTAELLQNAGAVAIESTYLDPDPASRRLPKWIYAFIVVTTAMALIPFALVLKAQASKSNKPHVHIFADMDFQPKAKADTAFELFPDGRASRSEIPGTIARGQLRADDGYYRGLAHPGGAGQGGGDDQWLTGLPAQVEVTEARLARGRQRYDIYCAPCHGYDGRGLGAIPERVKALGGAWLARNLVDPKAGTVTMPNGQLFNTISNGFNTMMGYAAQIPVDDRWSIVLYVRALQRAQNASLDDVPADRRADVTR